MIGCRVSTSCGLSYWTWQSIAPLNKNLDKWLFQVVLLINNEPVNVFFLSFLLVEIFLSDSLLFFIECFRIAWTLQFSWSSAHAHNRANFEVRSTLRDLLQCFLCSHRVQAFIFKYKAPTILCVWAFGNYCLILVRCFWKPGTRYEEIADTGNFMVCELCDYCPTTRYSVCFGVEFCILIR